jgi:ethylmalonyl-CoA mutase
MSEKTDGKSASGTRHAKERPWIMRTYAGYNTAQASNELYRGNLAKGQTGLSVAFDLPTQTGYDSDHPLAAGEVGKVGVPICHIEDMDLLFHQIPLDQMNTSMTINAPAAWLMSLYIAAAERQGVDPKVLRGTTQNDILKEYLSRGTYIFPPEHSLRLTRDVILYTIDHIPSWNPLNICSYHLQEAGATPAQELAFSLCNARAILDAIRGSVDQPTMDKTFARFSFFVNSGVRLIDEICKLRAFTRLWEELGRERYGVTKENDLRFRYGVQVNSLGLTAQQPENNVARIIVETLAVILSKDARARAVQLPAWNEALGLPRPWDQQWSLRIQQILAFETDILEYEDIFNGSHVIEARVQELVGQALEEIARVEELGGAAAAIDSGYMKQQLVQSNAARIAAIESGEQIVVGVNKYTETEPSPLLSGVDGGFFKTDPDAERGQIERLNAFRKKRDVGAVEAALRELAGALEKGENIMPVSIRAAHAGVTTGEWGDVLRRVFGEYRSPTGVGGVSTVGRENRERTEAVRARVEAVSEKLGRRLKVLIGKPGLDGHSNGAEQIAVRARDVGMEVVYEGIRLTPERIVNSAADEGVHLVGLSILSGSHLPLVGEVLDRMKQAELGHIPVIVGGIIPDNDRETLLGLGVARVYTPKDYAITAMMDDFVNVVETSLLSAV